MHTLSELYRDSQPLAQKRIIVEQEPGLSMFCSPGIQLSVGPMCG